VLFEQVDTALHGVTLPVDLGVPAEDPEVAVGGLQRAVPG
jgi:hypothetical protein